MQVQEKGNGKAHEKGGSGSTRRRFLLTTGAAASFMILPRRLIAGAGVKPPSEKLNIACIGVGGRGWDDLNGVAGENIVGLCDTDEGQLARAAASFPGARTFRDFRQMLDRMGSTIDAVVVATPDHTHAVAAVPAMQLGKHVYCEKPMAHSVHEVQAMMRAAKENKVVTQLGNQGHSFDSIRMFCEWVWDGAIGSVHTIHAYTSAYNAHTDQIAKLSEKHAPPASLNWDLWLGPAAYRPYHPAYQPGTWRGWVPFGCGSIGDWVCHVVDPVFWALELGAPSSVQAQCKDYDVKTQGLSHPPGTVVTYEFPASPKRGAIKMIWYDGTEKPPRPADLEKDDKAPDTGAVVMGDKGTIIYGSHGAGGVRLVPDAKSNAYRRPAKSIPRVKGHYEDWLQAIREGRKAGSDFSYGGPLTEIALLGNIAVKQLGQRLEWDGKAQRFTNSEEANRHLHPEFRSGWGV